MKKILFLFFLLTTTFSLKSQGILSLDSCRALAIANNKELLISGEKINAAHYQNKAAFTNYLPNFSATGAYMRNQKEFSLLNSDQKAALSGLGNSISDHCSKLHKSSDSSILNWPRFCRNWEGLSYRP